MSILYTIFSKEYPGLPRSNDEEVYKYLSGEGLSREEIMDVVSKETRMPFLDKDVDNTLAKKVTQSELLAYRLVPFLEDGELYFFTDMLLSGSLRNSGRRLARDLGYDKVAGYYYVFTFEFNDLLDKLLEKGSGNSLGEQLDDGFKLSSGYDASSVVDRILDRGFKLRASDIHIETLSSGTLHVRYRVDGVMSVLDPYDISARRIGELINIIKTRAGMDIVQRNQGQDGRISGVKHDGKVYDLRVSTSPVITGEKVVIRIFENRVYIPTLHELGFSKIYVDAITKDMSSSHGLILNTGSVGSGKSTTQTTLLNTLDAKENNIYSLEDPVERVIDYVNHICIKETGIEFEHHLESLLRQDPDIIAVGEVRNLKSMDIVLKAALTGHLVFATMHTNSAVEGFSRLFNLGVEAFELSSALLGIGSQRLVRTLCPYCKDRRKSTENERLFVKGLLKKSGEEDSFDFKNVDFVYDAPGCDHCHYTGYRGRTVVAEYLSANTEIKRSIAEGTISREVLLSLADDSFLPLEIDALNKVLVGKTTVSEIAKVV